MFTDHPTGLCLKLSVSTLLRGCRVHSLPRNLKDKCVVLTLLGCSSLKKLVASLGLLAWNRRKCSLFPPEKDGRRKEARKEKICRASG